MSNVRSNRACGLARVTGTADRQMHETSHCRKAAATTGRARPAGRQDAGSGRTLGKNFPCERASSTPSCRIAPSTTK